MEKKWQQLFKLFVKRFIFTKAWQKKQYREYITIIIRNVKYINEIPMFKRQMQTKNVNNNGQFNMFKDFEGNFHDSKIFFQKKTMVLL